MISKILKIVYFDFKLKNLHLAQNSQKKVKPGAWSEPFHYRKFSEIFQKNFSNIILEYMIYKSNKRNGIRTSQFVKNFGGLSPKFVILRKKFVQISKKMHGSTFHGD